MQEGKPSNMTELREVRKIRNWVLALTTILLAVVSIFSSPMEAKAEEKPDNSIVGDYFNKVFSSDPNNGSSIFSTESDIKEREALNESIYNGSATETYSLYDRFGGNLQFIAYYGETKISTGVLDRFYSKYLVNEDGFSLSASDIKILFKNPYVSNNVVYQNRADILSANEIAAGKEDPRVYAYSGISETGGEASIGNVGLSTSNLITSIVGFLSDGSLYDYIDGIWTNTVNGGLGGLIKNIGMTFIPVAIIFFLFYVVKRAFAILRGKESVTKLFKDMLWVVVSLGLFFSFTSNPLAISGTINSLTGYVDDTFAAAMSSEADEVVSSSKLDNVTTASLWEITVLEPWSEGMFDTGYKNMYTEYSDANVETQWPQSDEDVTVGGPWETPKFNSKGMTGDITVPIGNNQSVRNWAALAWSTNSIYHIDSILDSSTSNSVDTTWPKATTTELNKKIYVDDFRWIDAQLNISPAYYAPDDTDLNYTDARPYKQNFVNSGWKSFFLSLLLFPILIFAIRKIWCVIQIVAFGFRIAYFSFMNIANPDNYNMNVYGKKIFKPFVDFFWVTIMIYICVTFFTMFVGDNMMKNIAWLAFSGYLLTIKPLEMPLQVKRQARNVKRGVQNGMSRAKASWANRNN